MNIIRICVLAGLSMMLGGCMISSSKNGNFSLNDGNESDATVKKEVAIGEFKKVQVSQGIKVIFTQGNNSGKASVATTPEAEKYLKINVEGETLNVRYEAPSFKKFKVKGPSIVRVSSPELSNISASSGADFKINGSFSCNSELNVQLSSSADFEGESVKSPEMSVVVSSGGDFDLKKMTGNLNVNASSGSDFELGSLIGDLNVNASSGADCEIKSVQGKNISAQASSGANIDIDTVTVKLVSANASSGADITINGATDVLSKTASSGGSVNVNNLSVRK